MSIPVLPSELLLLVALIATVVVLLCLNILADVLQESTRWEQIRIRVRRKRRVLDGDPAARFSGEVIDVDVIDASTR